MPPMALCSTAPCSAHLQGERLEEHRLSDPAHERNERPSADHLTCPAPYRRLEALRDRERFDLIERSGEPVSFDLELVAALEVQPEPFAGSEVPGES